MLIRVRAALVEMRSSLVNTARGLAKSVLGPPVRSKNKDTFASNRAKCRWKRERLPSLPISVNPVHRWADLDPLVGGQTSSEAHQKRCEYTRRSKTEFHSQNLRYAVPVTLRGELTINPWGADYKAST